MGGGNNEVIRVFIDVLLIWGVSIGSSLITKPFKMSPLILYIIMGAVLGHFHILSGSIAIEWLANFAIVLLFLANGLEETVEHFIGSFAGASLVALGGGLVPFVMGFAVSAILWAESGWRVHLLIATAVAAKPVSLTLVLLQSMEVLKSRLASTLMSSAVLDDVGVLVLVSIFFPIVLAGLSTAGGDIALVPCLERPVDQYSKSNASVSFSVTGTHVPTLSGDIARWSGFQSAVQSDVQRLLNFSSVPAGALFSLALSNWTNPNAQRIDFTFGITEKVPTAAALAAGSKLPKENPELGGICLHLPHLLSQLNTTDFLETASTAYNDMFGVAPGSAAALQAVANAAEAVALNNATLSAGPNPGEGVDPVAIVLVFVKIISGFLILVVLHNFILPHNIKTGWGSKIPILRTYGIKHFFFLAPELMPLIVIAFGLGLGLLAHELGIETAIGAYFGGLLLEAKYLAYDPDDDDNASSVASDYEDELDDGTDAGGDKFDGIVVTSGGGADNKDTDKKAVVASPGAAAPAVASPGAAAPAVAPASAGAAATTDSPAVDPFADFGFGQPVESTTLSPELSPGKASAFPNTSPGTSPGASPARGGGVNNSSKKEEKEDKTVEEDKTGSPAEDETVGSPVGGVASAHAFEEVRDAVATAAFSWLGPIFFVNLGAQFIIPSNLGEVVVDALAVVAMVGGGQLAGTYLSARYLSKFTGIESLVMAAGHLPRAELLFLVIAQAKKEGLFSNEQFIVLAVAALILNILLTVIMQIIKTVYDYEYGEGALKHFVNEAHLLEPDEEPLQGSSSSSSGSSGSSSSSGGSPRQPGIGDINHGVDEEHPNASGGHKHHHHHHGHGHHKHGHKTPNELHPNLFHSVIVKRSTGMPGFVLDRGHWPTEHDRDSRMHPGGGGISNFDTRRRRHHEFVAKHEKEDRDRRYAWEALFDNDEHDHDLETDSVPSEKGSVHQVRTARSDSFVDPSSIRSRRKKKLSSAGSNIGAMTGRSQSMVVMGPNHRHAPDAVLALEAAIAAGVRLPGTRRGVAPNELALAALAAAARLTPGKTPSASSGGRAKSAPVTPKGEHGGPASPLSPGAASAAAAAAGSSPDEASGAAGSGQRKRGMSAGPKSLAAADEILKSEQRRRLAAAALKAVEAAKPSSQAHAPDADEGESKNK